MVFIFLVFDQGLDDSIFDSSIMEESMCIGSTSSTTTTMINVCKDMISIALDNYQGETI